MGDTIWTSIYVLDKMSDILESQRESMERRNRSTAPSKPYEPEPWHLNVPERTYKSYPLEAARETIAGYSSDSPLGGKELTELNAQLAEANSIERGPMYASFTPKYIDGTARLMGVEPEQIKAIMDDSNQLYLSNQLARFHEAPNPINAAFEIKYFDNGLNNAAEYRALFGGTVEDHRNALLAEMDLSEDFVADTVAKTRIDAEARAEHLIETSEGCDKTPKQLSATFEEASLMMKYAGINQANMPEHMSSEIIVDYERMMGVEWASRPMPRNAGYLQTPETEEQCPYPESGAGSYKIPTSIPTF